MWYTGPSWLEIILMILAFSLGGWAVWQGIFWLFGHVHLSFG